AASGRIAMAERQGRRLTKRSGGGAREIHDEGAESTPEPRLEAGADLTDKQRQVLAVIEQQVAQVGYAPTIREIGRQFGIRSTNGVNDHLLALEKKGYLQREGHKSRTLRVVRPSGEPSEGSAPAAPRKS